MLSFSFYQRLSQRVKQVFTVQTGVKTHRDARLLRQRNLIVGRQIVFLVTIDANLISRERATPRRSAGIVREEEVGTKRQEKAVFSLYFQQTYTFSHLPSLIAINAQ